jgi:parvulin-like peptidyl-prolyl isomerase
MRTFVRPFTAVSLAVCAFALLPICCAAFAQEAQQVDGMAAIVNGDVITYSQVRQLSAPREKLLRSQFTGQELENKLQEVRKLALKDLIDRRLIIQAFKKESYQIPDHIVDQRVHDIIRESFGGDRNTFIKTLEAQNYSLGEFKERNWKE